MPKILILLVFVIFGCKPPRPQSERAAEEARTSGEANEAAPERDACLASLRLGDIAVPMPERIDASTLEMQAMSVTIADSKQLGLRLLSLVGTPKDAPNGKPNMFADYPEWKVCDEASNCVEAPEAIKESGAHWSPWSKDLPIPSNFGNTLFVSVRACANPNRRASSADCGPWLERREGPVLSVDPNFPEMAEAFQKFHDIQYARVAVIDTAVQDSEIFLAAIGQRKPTKAEELLKTIAGNIVADPGFLKDAVFAGDVDLVVTQMQQDLEAAAKEDQAGAGLSGGTQGDPCAPKAGLSLTDGGQQKASVRTVGFPVSPNPGFDLPHPMASPLTGAGRPPNVTPTSGAARSSALANLSASSGASQGKGGPPTNYGAMPVDGAGRSAAARGYGAVPVDVAGGSAGAAKGYGAMPVVDGAGGSAGAVSGARVKPPWNASPLQRVVETGDARLRTNPSDSYYDKSPHKAPKSRGKGGRIALGVGIAVTAVAAIGALAYLFVPGASSFMDSIPGQAGIGLTANSRVQTYVQALTTSDAKLRELDAQTIQLRTQLDALAKTWADPRNANQ